MLDERLTRRGLVGAGLAGAAVLGTGTFRELSGGETGHAAGFGQTAAEGDAAFSGPLILPPERIGIQLYTVRDAVQSLGFATVFQTLSAIGYKRIEFAGYTQGTGAITTAQIRQLMDANGLVGIGSHVSPSAGAMEQILDDAETLGLPYVGISLVVPANTTVAGWQQTAEEYNTYGAAAAARNIGFYFHNHFQEWTLTEQAPTRGIDVLLAETQPNLVHWEMDIYWAYVGQFQSGQQPFPFDPLDYATQHRARIPFFHVKDGRRNQTSPLGYDIVDNGEGHIDFEDFFCTVGDQNRLYYLYEHDNAANHPQGSLVSSKFSYIQMRYGLQGCGPTAVLVRDFVAKARGRRVTLSWQTASETELVGFNVWRIARGSSQRVNRALIRAEYAGRARGAAYRVVDRSARRGVPYRYRLQLVHRDGTRSWAGAASITV